MTKHAIPAGPGVPTRGARAIPVLDLMALHPPDDTQGWRLVYQAKAANSFHPTYRAMQARAQRIRSGRVRYLASLGQWNSRVNWISKDSVGLFLRYEGSDGMRWTDDA